MKNIKSTLQIIAFCFLLLSVKSVSAQHEYYAAAIYGKHSVKPNYFGGSLFKLDSLGHNYKDLYEFDSTGAGGANPIGTLIQATNGKLYGTTQYGGTTNEGVLFVYDPVLDSFQVLLSLPLSCRYALLQASNGKIYYTSATNYGYFMEYDIPTNTLTQLNLLAPTCNPTGTLTEVKGKLYGVTGFGGGVGYGGRIYQYTLATGVFADAHYFDCTSEGCLPNNSPIYRSSNGLFYGVANQQVGAFSQGGLYSFNPATNKVVHLLNIPDSIGNAFNLTLGANDKIYGIGNYGTDAKGTHYNECIFEYDPDNNNIRTTYNFGWQSNGTYTGGQATAALFLASNGKMYGWNNYGPYEYDYLNTDTIVLTSPPQESLGGIQIQSLCEICRKPGYHYFKNDTIAVCPNEGFSFNIHSGNAKTFNWKKNNSILVTQTDSILHVSNFSVGDTGIYTCLMTNQCGITETMSSIRLVANSLPPASVITTNDSTTFCDGNSVLLAGNSKGLWNTGDSSSTLLVSSPGTYYVTDSNICGVVHSDSITIIVNSLPAPPSITQNGNILQSTIASSYQWYLNKTIIAGATSQTDTLTENGDYAVVVTNGYGCSSSSAIFTYLSTGINPFDSENNSITLFPTPTSDYITLLFQDKTEKNGSFLSINEPILTYIIFNPLGQVVKRSTLSINKTSTEIDVRDLPAGAYYLQFSGVRGYIKGNKFVKN